jgi:translation elongation factor EF-1alpha
MLIRNITLLGHKDHGKSTLIGSMLMQTHSVLDYRVEEAKKTSKKLGRPFEPGFILDSFHEEREGGLTMDTARAEVTYKRQVFTFIDVPGHEELIKNMISGASSGEMALLLVSAKSDEGIRDQTKRHIYISRMLGITKLVVAINKFDLIGYSKAEFDRIRNELLPFIEKIGFKRSNAYFVPISAYNGENLTSRSPNMKWYTGKPVMELLYENSKDEKRSDGPLRVMVQGLIDGKEGIIMGNVVNGSVTLGQKVEIVPGGTSAKVRNIAVKGRKVKRANSGENVTLVLDKRMSDAIRGAVIGEKNDPPKSGRDLSALVFVTGKINEDLRMGFNGMEIPCRITSIKSYIDTTTGNSSPEGKAAPLSAVVAQIRLEREIPFESFEKTRELGRFVLYNKRGFAGIGII